MSAKESEFGIQYRELIPLLHFMLQDRSLDTIMAYICRHYSISR